MLLAWSPARELFHLQVLDPGTWVAVVGLAFVPVSVLEIVKLLSRGRAMKA